MFKYFVVAAILGAPCLAFAGQGMSIDDSYAVASNASSEIDTVIAPMQDGGAADTAHEPKSSRGSDEADNRTQPDNSLRTTHTGRSVGSDAAASTRAHRGHGSKAPWQSLLPGVMK